ncbi:SGNH/GDSL hydrolase family protein [Burkholderia sp. Ac-20384]|uniref:SGNH/GDSL hydrolase family protein n=1 Tax=Burkholderia sp. Ac-20384 TaxID=2703902 RepID=UPI00197EE45A|nr:SGNH/GDSL hydrolase family protein [Burkholderia sp. Ac-20384]MBN3823113.1 SGNH/GDSL hydrolase family protein [Burkholderia sp. Ac-20384]
MTPDVCERLPFRFWRRCAASVQKGGRKRVLVLGDSHVRVFEHAWFVLLLPQVQFDVEYVPGATAIGIDNRHSITSALLRFTNRLHSSSHDWVLLNLGEVDTAYSLWKLVEFRSCPIPVLLDEAIRNYCDFITEVAESHRVAVLSAPLPTLADQAAPHDETAAVRQQVAATQRERTELAREFNARVKAFCITHGVPYLDSSQDALGADGLVKSSWKHTRRFDHHYARGPYARSLVRQLKVLFAGRSVGCEADRREVRL